MARRRRTETEIRAALAGLEAALTAAETGRGTKTFRLLAYQSIESLRWVLGETPEHPLQHVLDAQPAPDGGAR